MNTNRTVIYTYDKGYVLPFALEGNYELITGPPNINQLYEYDNLIIIVENLDRLNNMLEENQGMLPDAHYIIAAPINMGPTMDTINITNYILRKFPIDSRNLTVIPQHLIDSEDYIKKILEKKMSSGVKPVKDTNSKADVFEEILSQKVNIMNLNNAVSNNNNNNNNNDGDGSMDVINIFEYDEILRREENPAPPVRNARDALQNVAIGLPNFVRNKWFLLGLTSSVLVGGLVYLIYKSPLFGKSIQDKIPIVTTEFINNALDDETIPTDTADIAQLYVEYIKASSNFTEEEHQILNPVLDNIVIEENIQPADTNITPDYAIEIVNPGENSSRLKVIEPVIVPELYLEQPNKYYGPENMPIYDLPENRPIYDLPENKPIYDLPENRPIYDLPENRPIYDLPENRPIYDLPEFKDTVIYEKNNNYVIDVGKTYNKNADDGIFPFNTNFNIEAVNINIIKEFEQQNSNKYLLYAGGGLLLIGLVLRLYK